MKTAFTFIGESAFLTGVRPDDDDTEARLASVISGNVSSRLADYLISLPAKPGPRGTVEVSLQLRNLTDSGVISQQDPDRITITDVTALSALSTFMKKD